MLSFSQYEVCLNTRENHITQTHLSLNEERKVTPYHRIYLYFSYVYILRNPENLASHKLSDFQHVSHQNHLILPAIVEADKKNCVSERNGARY